MMNVLIVDDEQLAIDELEFLLRAYDGIEIKGSYTSPKKALEYVLMNDVDVIFLDISMPEMDGFILAEALLRLRKPPYIVFVTAYDEYAIKAFEINAVDYLLKPLTSDRLTKTVDKLVQLGPSEDAINAVQKVVSQRYIEKRAIRLPLWRDDRIHLISPESIAFMETKDGDTHIKTEKGDFISTETLGHYEEILQSYGFFRCHRSYLIRLESISEVIPWFNNTYQVKLSGYEEDEIPVSRRNVKAFKEHLNM